MEIADMNGYAYSERIDINGEKLFTVIMLPQKGSKIPTVVMRSPYVDNTAREPEENIVQNCLKSVHKWLNRGYAMVFQHCRGKGKSTGAFVPYIYEREDGLEFRKWIRKQPFYNGEIYLMGASYTSSLHYATAPFEEDILGAVFEVQDSERYNLWYRNGQMRKGHANWHFGLYKTNCGLNKSFNMASFSQLPLKGLSQRVLCDNAEDFEQMLTAQFPSNEFWNTRFGGAETKNAVANANIPILLTTGYNDFYVGGVFKMWNSMGQSTKGKSALLVSPYNHGDGICCENGLSFANGRRSEQFGSTYAIDWFDSIRNNKTLPYPKGKITYYRTFEDKWQSGFYETETKLISVPRGDKTLSFRYNPLKPTAVSCEGTFAKESADGENFVRVFTKPFDKDVFIKGQMKAALAVSSNCEDTSLYVRISVKNPRYTYVLRHDITSLCYQLGGYSQNDTVKLSFCFDEYAFLLKKGECLQIDIASTDDNTYVSHTNKKGEYYLQTETREAVNTVYLAESQLLLPIEQL